MVTTTQIVMGENKGGDECGDESDADHGVAIVTPQRDANLLIVIVSVRDLDRCQAHLRSIVDKNQTTDAFAEGIDFPPKIPLELYCTPCLPTSVTSVKIRNGCPRR